MSRTRHLQNHLRDPRILDEVIAVLSNLLFVLLTLISLFLILVVLLQRGRGGGLVGALGGSGGVSAFGTKTGDVFTKITIYVACVWGVLCMILVRINATPERFGTGPVRNNQPAASGEASPGEETAPKPAQPASPSGLPSAIDDL